MNTVSASRITQANSAVWRPQHSFYPSSPCLFRLLPHNITIRELCLALLFFLLQALFAAHCAYAEAAFCIEAVFFLPAESPDHLLLVKGASAPLKTKTKVNCATVVEFEATILSCTQCPHNHRNGEKGKSKSTTNNFLVRMDQIVFLFKWMVT